MKGRDVPFVFVSDKKIKKKVKKHLKYVMMYLFIYFFFLHYKMRNVYIK